MKPRVYLIILLLLIPIQASLFNPLSLGGIKPDLALALIYIIGLLAGPGEGALAGMGIGLLQDIGSAGLLGFAGFTRGLVGLLSGLLGRQVLNISSPSNIVFLVAFSLVEGVLTALFMQIFFGSVPFFRMFFSRMLPQALYTGLLGIILLRLINDKRMLGRIRRRTLKKEL